MKTRLKIVLILIIGASNSFAQNPGGVTGLSSWFKADQNIYINAGTTPATNNGDVIMQWNNLVTNANLPSVSKSNVDAQFLTKNHPYYNFNDVIEFLNDKFSNSTPYDAVFHPTNGLAVFTCASTVGLSFTFTSQSTSSPCGANRCCTGFRWNKTQISNGINLLTSSTVSSRANIIGAWGTPGISHSNNINGVWALGGSSNVLTNNGNYFYGIGSFPGYKFTGIITETITYSRDLTSTEVNKIQSYMAIKYGITLGVNGTSVDYLSSNGVAIWDATVNAGYGFDIAGIARDDASGLTQLKSHSVNNTAMVFDDVLIMVNGNDFMNPSSLSADNSFFTWGHNGQGLNCDSSDVGLTQGGLLIGERLARKWKSQETGTVGLTTIEFDMNAVSMGSIPVSDYRLLVDVDGVFNNGATAISPSVIDTINNKLYFEHDFNGISGFYFSIGIPKIEISIAGSTTICDGDSTLLTFNYTGTASPIDISFTNGVDTLILSNVLNGETFLVGPNSTTIYNVLQEGSACVAYTPSLATITVTPLPVVNIGPDLIVCEDSTVMLNAIIPNGSYLWQDNSITPTYVPTETGLYWVDVTVNNCASRDSVNLLVNTLPVFSLEGEPTICHEPELLKTNILFQDYLWNDLSSDSVLEVHQPGVYGVVVTDTNNCKSYNEFEVTLKCPSEITIPNVFSPNGDGMNDYFNGMGEFIESYEMQIFNRWGTLMFENTSIELYDGWDGTTKSGKEAPVGTYFCVISYSYFDANQELINDTKKGSLSLFR